MEYVVQELEIAKQTAIEAALYLQRLETKIVNNAEGKDIKLQADLESEEIIINVLSQHFNYPILSEESGELNDFSQEGRYWVVDPIDGTLNFSRAIPFSCISIALYEKQTPILGVIYDFNRNEMFSALVGVGAWLNERPIHASNVTVRSNAVIATGFPSLRSYDKSSLDEFVTFVRDFKKVRLFGSAALSLAYVASGRIDAYCEDGIRFWDVAAGLAIVQAAGGSVYCRFDHQPYTCYVLCGANQILMNE